MGEARRPARRLALCLVGAAIASACVWHASPPRNVLLITVDTLRADHLGVYGGGLGLTPNIDRLAAASEVFTAAYAPAPFTLASVSALHTGRYPQELGMVSNASVLPAGTSTLAGMLRSQGWRTGAVVSSYVLRDACGLAGGFEAYDANYPEMEAQRHLPERTAVHTTDAALNMLDRLSTPSDRGFLLWVHFQDPHGPYTPPAALREQYLPVEQRAPDGRRLLSPSPDDGGLGGIPRYQLADGEREVAYYRAGYDGEVRYMDEEVGRLLAGLDERGFARDTVVVFTADHGEGLGEDDYWFAHGEFLTDVLVRVPLLVHVPGRAPRTRSESASLLDVVPTVTRVLGVPLAPGVRGRDLLTDGSSTVYLATLEDATVPRFGVVAGGHKYVTSLEPSGPRQRLSRLGSDDTDLLDQAPDVARDLRAQLAAFREMVPAGVPGREQPLAPADRDRLRALGYLGG